MNLLGIAWVLTSFLPAPAAVQDAGAVTFLEGSLRIIRGTTTLEAVEGTRLTEGDIVETSQNGFVQLEFVDGATVALGPSTGIYIFRHGTGGSAGAELVLLNGWLKGQADARGGSYRFETPMLAATTGDGVVLFHQHESDCEVFVESGAAAIGEVSSGGSAGKPTPGKAGQFFSRRKGKSLVGSSRPDAAFLEAMPRPFRDALPSRLAHFAGRSAQPKAQRPVSYAEIRPWLIMPPAWRKGFVDRFGPRLKDPEFRKQLEVHAAEHPEWAPLLTAK